MAEKFKTLRSELGMSQQDVSDGAGITKSSLSRIESGQRLPSFAALRGLCQVYGVSADYFLGLEFQISSLADKIALLAKKCLEAFDLAELAEFYDEDAQKYVKELDNLLRDYLHLRGLDDE